MQYRRDKRNSQLKIQLLSEAFAIFFLSTWHTAPPRWVAHISGWNQLYINWNSSSAVSISAHKPSKKHKTKYGSGRAEWLERAACQLCTKGRKADCSLFSDETASDSLLNWRWCKSSWLQKELAQQRHFLLLYAHSCCFKAENNRKIMSFLTIQLTVKQYLLEEPHLDAQLPPVLATAQQAFTAQG